MPLGEVCPYAMGGRVLGMILTVELTQCLCIAAVWGAFAVLLT